MKRDDILNDLEIVCQQETHKHAQLLAMIQQLQERRRQLQALFVTEIPYPQPIPMVFGNTSFLSSITDTPAPPLPPHQLQLVANNEEQFARLLQPNSQLTNSAYNEQQQSNCLFNSQAPVINMSSASFDRILNDISSPSFVDNNNNNTTTTTTGATYSELCNSAYGAPTCAQQHSSSGEDDSMPSTHRNSYVY